MLRFKQAFIIFFTLFLSSCISKPVAPENSRFIRSSSKQQPEWILKKKSSENNYYFVGVGKKNKDIQGAKKSAISDGASRLLEFIGLRATTKLKISKEFKEDDESLKFKEEIIQTLEGKSSADIIIDIEDTYFEEYTDGYIFYVLVRSPKKWVEKERERLKQLTLEQREKSSNLLGEARLAFEKGEVVKAMDLAYTAFEISERAAENSDLYEEAKDLILLILSSIRISTFNTNIYIYKEGGSDLIRLKVTSTKTDIPVKGLFIENISQSEITLSSTKGLQSDNDGLITFTIDKLNSFPSNQKIPLSFSFSTKKFDGVKDIDPDFYMQIIKYQKMIALNLTLEIKEKYKTLLTAVLVINEANGRIKFDKKFQSDVTALLASKGYRVEAIEVKKTFKKTESTQDFLTQEIKTNFPFLKNLIIIYRKINYLGELGKDIKFSEYDIKESGIKIVEIESSTSIINLETKQTEKGQILNVKGHGLNESQAFLNAEKKLLEYISKSF